MAEYPYLRSNKNLPQIFEKIRTAAKPPKFTIAFVKQLGFTNSNDAAYPSLLKKLGYLMEDGTPTAYYDDLRDSGTMGRSLASRIRELYSELFVINTKINEASEGDIKGAISRVTGKEAKDVTSIASTFRALCGLADFSEPTETVQEIAHNFEEKTEAIDDESTNNVNNIITPDFHYNIQIHLPATTDISVYNAIFKSIKENLLS